MKHTTSSGGYANRYRNKKGFSLLELLAVMTMMAIAMALGGNLLTRTASNGVQLTQAANDLVGSLSLARQTALSSNRYVQVRFYKRVQGDDSYTHVGLFLADSPLYGQTSEYKSWQDQGSFSQFQKIHRLPSPCVILGDQNASRLLSDLAADSGTARTGTSDLGGEKYNWVAFYFCPDGSTDLPGSGSMYGGGAAPSGTPDTYITMSAGLVSASGSGSLPANFAAVVVNPANGRVSLFRP